MLELFILLCIFGVGWVAGQTSAYWKMRDIILDSARKSGIDLNDDFTVNKKSTNVRKLSIFKIEVIKDVLYLYDVATDKFICQANSIDELAQKVTETKYSKIAGVLYGDCNIWFVDGKVLNSLAEIKSNEN